MKQTTLFAAMALLMTGCTYYENYKEDKRIKDQLEFEEVILKTMERQPRRDTLTLGYVLGWTEKKVSNHTNNLIKEGKARIEEGFLVFDAPIIMRNQTFPTIIVHEYNEGKLIGVRLKVAGDYLFPIVVESSFRKAYDGMGFFYYKNPEYRWFYSGKNLKIITFKDLYSTGIRVNIIDRVIADSLSTLENEKNRKKIEATEHVL